MRVLIAENQSKARFALRVTLERQPGFKTVSEAVDAQDLLCQTEALHPDLLLLNWELTGTAAEEILCNLRKLCPQLFIIALSEKEEAREAAIKAGVNAFVSKADPPEQLLCAISAYCDREQARTIIAPETVNRGATEQTGSLDDSGVIVGK